MKQASWVQHVLALLGVLPLVANIMIVPRFHGLWYRVDFTAALQQAIIPVACYSLIVGALFPYLSVAGVSYGVNR